MQKLLIIIGVFLVIIGLFWKFISKLPFGRLPGDIVINKPGFKLFLPITTMIIISIILSLIIWLIRKF